MRITSSEKPALGPKGSWVKMDDLAHSNSTSSNAKNATEVEEDITKTMTGTIDAGHGPSSSEQQGGEAHTHAHAHGGAHHRSYSHTHYRVYKRRWFGLIQLVLLNIVVSWDVRICLLIRDWRTRGLILGIVVDVCTRLNEIGRLL